MQLKVVHTDRSANRNLIDGFGPRMAVAIRAQLHDFVHGATRKDPTVDLENVHQMRVAVRTIRSYFRAFRAEIGALTEAIDIRLGELARDLGRVRDLDVQIERLEDADAVKAELNRMRDSARAELSIRLASADCSSLISAVRSLAQKLMNSSSLAEPFEHELLRAIAKARKQAWRKAKMLEMQSPALEFHAVRKGAKRLRYLTELAPEGEPRDQAIERLKKLQDVLGERQDLSTADRLLLDLRDHSSPEIAAAAERLALEAENHEPKLRKKILKEREALRMRSWRSILG